MIRGSRTRMLDLRRLMSTDGGLCPTKVNRDKEFLHYFQPSVYTNRNENLLKRTIWKCLKVRYMGACITPAWKSSSWEYHLNIEQGFMKRLNLKNEITRDWKSKLVRINCISSNEFHELILLINFLNSAWKWTFRTSKAGFEQNGRSLFLKRYCFSHLFMNHLFYEGSKCMIWTIQKCIKIWKIVILWRKLVSIS